MNSKTEGGSVGKIQSFQDLDVWREGHKLVLIVYTSTKHFPKDETFGLVSQLKRAAVSVTSNIAEGFGRKSIGEKIQFYHIAKGSLIELHNQLLVSRDVSYLSQAEYQNIENQLNRVHTILNAFIASTYHFSGRG